MKQIRNLTQKETRSIQEKWRNATLKGNKAKAYHFIITPMQKPQDSASIPREIVFLRPDPLQKERDQLFLDRQPISPDEWNYEETERILSWKYAYGGGYLKLSYIGHGGNGVIGGIENLVSVKAEATAEFLCNVASDCGVVKETQGERVVGLSWDVESAQWKNAKWREDALQLKYTVKTGTSMSPPEFSFIFTDTSGEEQPWKPRMGMTSGSLKLITDDKGNIAWKLVFESKTEPDVHTQPGIYPTLAVCMEDAAASWLTGAMRIGGIQSKEILMGIEGKRSLPTAVGYYQMEGRTPFAVFGGRLYIDGECAGESVLDGNLLSWSGIEKESAEAVGLPECGKMVFTEDGIPKLTGQDGETVINRLEIGKIQNFMGSRENKGELSIVTLQVMDPYVQDEKGGWYDFVQSKVTDDLKTVMNSYVQSEMWEILYPDQSQPKLEGELAEIAATDAEGEKAKDFYQNLALSVLVSGLAEGNDENCQYLNGVRAEKWMNVKTGQSKVYYLHSQKLFQYHWKKKFPETSLYLQDQIENAEVYQTQIDSQIELEIDDIEKNVENTPDNPNLKDKMKQYIQAAGDYAKEKNLFWAFAFYTYNTAPGILANIAMEIGFNTGTSDKMLISRMLQKNISMLTILDPSGYFSKEYVHMINSFMAMNILPSYLDYSGGFSDFDAVKEYMTAFVEKTLQSEDDEIKEKAKELKELIESAQGDEILKTSIEILKGLTESTAEIMEFPYVAQNFVKKLQTTIPGLAKTGEFLGSVILGGISFMAVFTLIGDAKEWKKMTVEEKGELILGAVEFGIQILAGVVQREIRIYSIFNIEEMTCTQRLGAITNILFSGKGKNVDIGMAKIGSSTARWLADTGESAGKMAVLDLDMNITVLCETGEEVSTLSKIFGRNLGEVICKAIGPVIIVGGMVFSAWNLIKGESGLEKDMEILNLCSGALMLVAIAGEWMVAGGMIAEGGILATCISIAGPLSVLAALAGIGIMLYMMFNQKNPLKDFIDQYVKESNFYLESRYRSIEYILPYINPEKNSTMVGFSLKSESDILHVQNGGTVIFNAQAGYLPDCVFKCSADEYGISKIYTILEEKDEKQNSVLKIALLSLMNDGTIAFAPVKKDGDNVKSQKWISVPEGKADILNKDGKYYLQGLNMKLQAADETGKGIENAWMTKSGTGLAGGSTGDKMYACMQYMAPNYMKISSLTLIHGTKDVSGKSVSPMFGTEISMPAEFSISPELPKFLNFDNASGSITVREEMIDKEEGTYDFKVSCNNHWGNGKAEFELNIKGGI